MPIVRLDRRASIGGFLLLLLTTLALVSFTDFADRLAGRSKKKVEPARGHIKQRRRSRRNSTRTPPSPAPERPSPAPERPSTAPERPSTAPERPSMAPEQTPQPSTQTPQPSTQTPAPTPPPTPRPLVSRNIPSWVTKYLEGGKLGGNITSKRDNKCDDNTKCFLQNGCVSTEDGVCYHPEYDLYDYTYKPVGWDAAREAATCAKHRPRRTLPAGGDKSGSELKCSWTAEEASPLPVSDLRNLSETMGGRAGDVDANRTHEVINNQTTSAARQRTINNFKHFTGSFFQKWYDWDAPVKEVTRTAPKNLTSSGGQNRSRTRSQSSNFELRGSHQGRDQLYVLENFCVRPAGGRLAGYRPKLGKFKGGYDMVMMYGPDRKGRLALLNDWLSNVESLEEEPTWYVDRPISIQQVVGLHQVPHSMTRLLSSIANIDIVFPRNDTAPDQCTKDWARDDVTTMLLEMRRETWDPDPYGKFVDPLTWDKKGPNWDTMLSHRYSDYHRYINLATTTHFHSFTTLDKKMALEWFNASEKGDRFLRGGSGGGRSGDGSSSSSPAAPPPPRATWEDFWAFLNTPLCFKKATFYQSCLQSDCKTAKKTKRSSWPMFGYRNPVTHATVARRFRACALVEGTTSLRRAPDAPNVLLMYRATHRRMTALPHLVEKVQAWMSTRLGPTAKLRVRQFVPDGAWELTAVFAETDVILSPWGTECIYSMVMPPGQGSVMIDIGRQDYTMNRHTGFSPIHTDYGSTMRALNAWGMSIVLPPAVVRRGGTFEIPLDLAVRALNAAMCLRIDSLGRRGKNNNSSSADSCAKWAHPVKEYPPVNKWLMADYAAKMFEDPSGVILKRNVRAALPASAVPDAPRLVAMYNSAAAELSDAFSRIRAGAASGSVLLLYNTKSWPRLQYELESERLTRLQDAVAAEFLFLSQHIPIKVPIRIMAVDPSPTNAESLPFILRPHVYAFDPASVRISGNGDNNVCPTLKLRGRRVIKLLNRTVDEPCVLGVPLIGQCACRNYALVLADDGIFANDDPGGDDAQAVAATGGAPSESAALLRKWLRWGASVAETRTFVVNKNNVTWKRYLPV